MKRNLVLYKALLVCSILISNQGICQFTYKASIGGIKQSGFHKIWITPALSAKSNADLSDIRIVDEYGKSIPYILNREQPVFNERELRVFPVISKKTTPDSNVQMILQSAFSDVLFVNQPDSSFILVMQKADAYRDASISGSDDLLEWYTVIDRFIVNAANDGVSDRSIQVIPLPSNRYKYLRLTIKNKGLQPINIVKAGTLLSKNIFGKYVELPAPGIRQVDSSNKKSYVAVRFNELYPLSKLGFTIAKPQLYKRKLTIYDTSGARSIKIAETMIDPSTDSIMLDGRKSKDLVMVVENNDDQPLQFANATGYQLQHFIVADLQQGRKYSMLMGYHEAAAPVYDLRFFSSTIKIVDEVTTVEAPAPHNSNAIVKGIKKGNVSFVWIWVAIGVVLLSLLWLSYRLIKDISNKKEQ